MGHIEINAVEYRLPDGRELLSGVNLRVGDGAKAALVGTNGAGKTTLLRIIAGDIAPRAGSVVRSGGLGVMRQFIGTGRGVSTVRDLLASVAAPPLIAAYADLRHAAAGMHGSEADQLRYADALVRWGEAGGYDAEVFWDECCTRSLGRHYDEVHDRDVMTLSGGEQKKLVLEALLRGPDEVLLLDEPDNYLDVPGKRWLEARLNETAKTVLYVSHDRELLAHTAGQIITIENNSAWVYGDGFDSYHQARRDRHTRFEELHRRWSDERDKLADLVKRLQLANSSKTQAAMTRLRRHEAVEPELPPQEQKIRMRLGGGRTGVRVLSCVQLALTGLTGPFDLEVFYGDRVAVLGFNGTGKSHFLRLLAGWPDTDAVKHSGDWKLGARVVPGHFSQTHEHPELAERTLLQILWDDCALRMEQAAPALHRYDLTGARDQKFGTLSGGQQARFQILLLELSGATMLILDEPTDNLDVASAEALESALEEFDGTVVAVTHDRWFARSFGRFVVFGADGAVRETPEPVWDR
ncbi:MAG TPA: ATP-binding cassette domain-containing protein [Mycobacteriales bacterium]|nr:ATP-binding cassette domain-containing protein [Mycobacteriales bacterium]